MSGSAATRRWFIWLCLILLVTASTYAPCLDNGYTYDDAIYVQAPNGHGHRNKLIRHWQGLSTYFSTRYGEDTGSPGRGFRPITVISFALVHRWAGAARVPEPDVADPSATDPDAAARAAALAQHVLSLGLLLLCVVVAFELIARFTGRGWPALVGAAVFGLHAIRSDPVVSLVGRAEQLAFVFGGAATLLYLAALKRSARLRWLLLPAASVSLFLALGSKESAAAWIAFAPLTAYLLGMQAPAWRQKTTVRRQFLPWLLWAAAPTVVFGVLLSNIAGGDWNAWENVGSNPLAVESVGTRIATAVMVLAYGAFKVLWPFWPSPDYNTSFSLVQDFGDYRFWLSALVLLSWLGAGLWSMRRVPLLCLAVATWFGFTFITSNLSFVVETIFAERLLFTPAFALSILLALVASILWGRPAAKRARVVFLAVLSIWLCGSIVVILLQCDFWRDDDTLFKVSGDRHPDSCSQQLQAARCYYRDGYRVGFAGAQGDALRYRWKSFTEAALRANPDYVDALIEMAYWHLTSGQSSLGGRDQDQAHRHFIKTKSFIERAFASPRLRLKRDGPRLYQLRGDLHLLEGRRDLAQAEYQKAIEADPLRTDSYRFLGDFHFAKADYEKGYKVLQDGLVAQPQSLGLRELVLRVAIKREDWDAFDQILKEGRQLFGDDPVITVLQGRMLHARARYAEALSALHAGLRDLPFNERGYDWFALADSLLHLQRQAEGRRILQRIADSPRALFEVAADARKKLSELASPSKPESAATLPTSQSSKPPTSRPASTGK